MKNYYEYRPQEKSLSALLTVPGYVVCICPFILAVFDDVSYAITRLFRLRKGRVVEEMNLQNLQHHRILDLSIDGDYWDGDVLGKNPCGWGNLYNERNCLTYHGCMILSYRMCYGEEYYNVPWQRLRYAGGWIQNKRMGYGRLCDLNGAVIAEGDWINDSFREASSVEINSNIILATLPE